MSLALSKADSSICLGRFTGQSSSPVVGMVESSQLKCTSVGSNSFFHRLLSYQTANATTYPDVLDGAMVTLAIITLNLAHPGVLLRLPKLDAY